MLIAEDVADADGYSKVETPSLLAQTYARAVAEVVALEVLINPIPVFAVIEPELLTLFESTCVIEVASELAYAAAVVPATSLAYIEA